MRKAYEAHENEYMKMKSKGIKSWSQRSYPYSISPPDKRFLKDVLMQTWVAKKGRAIELGCGTGTISRWLAKKGFRVTGVDISKTAIQMAKAQSKGLKINPAPRDKSRSFTRGGVKYINKDFCLVDTKSLGKNDLCVDGQFLHCITDKKDRNTVLRKIRQILNPGGVFVVMSMCSPVYYKNFAKVYTTQKILGRVIYIEADKYGEFQGLRTINRKKYIPTRYIAHWKKLLSELNEAGFSPMITQYIRYDKNNPKEPTGLLNVATIRN